MKFLVAMSVCLAACAGAARADEAAIRRSLEPKMGGVKIESVSITPMPGVYEVQYRSADGTQIVYTDANGAFIIQNDGHLVDMKGGRDITEERLRKLNAIKFESLPFDQAVKVQRGNGKRVMAMFSDPYCPACKQFEQTLQQIDDITIYVFMFPVIRPELAEQSKAVWCSPDRAKAWLDVALRGKPPPAKANCANPVEKNVELGRSLGVNSTPTLVLGNGERVTGGLSRADLVDVLDAKR